MPTASVAYVSPTIRASGTNFAGLQAGGLVAHLNNLITQNPAIANPTTQATATATGGGATGGSLPAGTYYVSYTWVDGAGETTAGTSESAQLTVAATNIPRVTIPALPTGVGSANIYLTQVGGASGSEVLYCTGVTGTTIDLAGATYADPLRTPPATNTTGLSAIAGMVKAGVSKYLQESYEAYTHAVSNYLRGNPTNFADARDTMMKRTAAFKALVTAMDEINTLVHANTGTLTTQVSSVGAGFARKVRTFP